MGTLLVLSLIGSNLYVSFKWRQAQTDVQRLRDELGYLTIDDPTRFYVRELPTLEPLNWRWRIYVPQGERDFCAGVGRIPIEGAGAGSSGRHYSRRSQAGSPLTDPMQGEYTLTARIERNQLGNWRLVIQYPDGGLTQAIMPPDAGWLSAEELFGQVRSNREIQATAAGGNKQTESFAADDMVVLLRLRAPKHDQTPNEPCDGVIIWFEKREVQTAKKDLMANSAASSGASQ
jgi:hypothetical protein